MSCRLETRLGSLLALPDHFSLVLAGAVVRWLCSIPNFEVASLLLAVLGSSLGEERGYHAYRLPDSIIASTVVKPLQPLRFAPS